MTESDQQEELRRLTDFGTFMGKLHELVEDGAKKKGYLKLAPLMRELELQVPLSIGEVFTKAMRFQELGHEEDLLDIAGAAYVLWVHEYGKSERISS